MGNTVFIKIFFSQSHYALQQLDAPIKHTDIVSFLNEHHPGWVDFYVDDTYNDAISHSFDYTPVNNIPKRDAVEWCESNYPEMCAEFKQWQEEQYKLLCRKQMDYGPLNISMGTQLRNDNEIKASLTGIIVRANDKMQRLVNLVIINGQSPQNESIEDTFMDLANYANIALTVKNGKWGR
jgi:hypothetical protein